MITYNLLNNDQTGFKRFLYCGKACGFTAGRGDCHGEEETYSEKRR